MSVPPVPSSIPPLQRQSVTESMNKTGVRGVVRGKAATESISGNTLLHHLHLSPPLDPFEVLKILLKNLLNFIFLNLDFIKKYIIVKFKIILLKIICYLNLETSFTVYEY